MITPFKLYRTSTELIPHFTLDIDQLYLPDKVYISEANFKSKRFTFSWSPVTTDCSTIHYKILASNCGSCPTNTTHTNATCTGVPTDSSVCTFAIQAVVCGNITRVTSDKIKVTLDCRIHNVMCICSGIIILLCKWPSFVCDISCNSCHIDSQSYFQFSWPLFLFFCWYWQ